MSNFEKGQSVVKVIIGGGVKTATVQKVESVVGGTVRLVDSSLEYSDKTGREIDSVIPGFTSELIYLEVDPCS
jgi:hypothetical protein